MANRGRAPKESTPARAMDAALRLLSLRARSEEELRRALLSREFSPEHGEEALRRCRDLGYLDDEAFALERARGMMRTGRGVGPKVLQTLARQGVSARMAQEALAQAQSENSPRQILKQAIQKRFATFDYHQADERERRRVVNYFLRRGFCLSLILDYLKNREVEEHDDW